MGQRLYRGVAWRRVNPGFRYLERRHDHAPEGSSPGAGAILESGEVARPAAERSPDR